MDTRKLRVDFSAHESVVVEVRDDENAEMNAIAIALRELQNNCTDPSWEVDDGGIEDVEDENEMPVNNIDTDYY